MRNYQKKEFARKTEIVTIRFTEEQHETIAQGAKVEGVSISDYVRDRMEKGRIAVKTEVVADKTLLKQLIAQLGKINSNLKQIERHYSGNGTRALEMQSSINRACSTIYKMKYDVEALGGVQFRGYGQTRRRKQQ